MKKYILTYRKWITLQLQKQDADWERILDYHKQQIAFFSHERLVHLIVTVLFALLTIFAISAFAITKMICFLPLSVLFLVLLVPYIKHYWLLENQTQGLYDDYNKLYEKCYGVNYEKL